MWRQKAELTKLNHGDEPGKPRFARLLRTSILCAALAGVYGALHDQISYTISPEYFTFIKFPQFQWMGLSSYPRLFVAAIGFMATWWVGFAGGWLLGRLGPTEQSSESKNNLWKALTVAFAVTIVGGVIGVLLGYLRSQGELGDWKVWLEFLDAGQLRDLIIVAYLHWASYIGGTIGIIAAATFYRRLSRKRL